MSRTGVVLWQRNIYLHAFHTFNTCRRIITRDTNAFSSLCAMNYSNWVLFDMKCVFCRNNSSVLVAKCCSLHVCVIALTSCAQNESWSTTDWVSVITLKHPPRRVVSSLQRQHYISLFYVHLHSTTCNQIRGFICLSAHNTSTNALMFSSLLSCADEETSQ